MFGIQQPTPAYVLNHMHTKIQLAVFADLPMIHLNIISMHLQINVIFAQWAAPATQLDATTATPTPSASVYYMVLLADALAFKTPLFSRMCVPFALAILITSTAIVWNAKDARDVMFMGVRIVVQIHI